MDEIEELRGRHGTLEALNALMYELLTRDYDAMLDAVVERSLAMLGAERGFLALLSGGGVEYRVVRNWSLDDLAEGREHVSSSILKEVFDGGAPLLVADASADARYQDRGSVRRFRIRSVLAAPLEADGLVIGALYLESRNPDRVFREHDLDLFRRILDVSGRALESSLRRLVAEERARHLERDVLARYDLGGIATSDPAFIRVLETVGRVASSDLSVLVQGPSGSGKELIAKALHVNGPRRSGPLITVNCGAISPQLLESELFGHVKGAFTGAVGDKRGLMPAADGGTLFLDEVAELPLELQPKLLRAIQFGEVTPVGALKSVRFGARVVSATNRDLEREVKAGRFREDLFFRLNAITLQLPALHQRRDDVLPLFHHFLREGARVAGHAVPAVSPALERRLVQHGWPGNVRELQNEAGRLLAVTPPGEPLTVERLSERITRGAPAAGALPALADQERELIELHLRRHDGNRSQAARSLGISRETLRQKLKRYGL